MTKDKYHHGDLKKDLMSKGLQLLGTEGYEGFSIRKIAALCGVSHAAPYKHFQSKEAMVAAIIADVSWKFGAMVKDVMDKYAHDPKTKNIEMGKHYTKFMVENPDYFRFMFLTNHYSPIHFTGESIEIDERHSGFNISLKCAEDFFDSINLEKEKRAMAFLSIWSLAHGSTVMLIHGTVAYSGDYLELVAKMLKEKLESLERNQA